MVSGAGQRDCGFEGLQVGFLWGTETFELSDGVPSLDTTLVSARPLAKDQLGRPVLVENRIGEGRVWTLTVGDYWGNPALSAMRVFGSFRSVTICSAVLSVICAFSGMIISILAGTPVGSTIVAVDVVVFALCSLIGFVKRGGLK